MSSSYSAWEDGLVPIHSVGYWLHHWFWSSTPATSLTSCFPLVEGLPSWFTRVALLRPGEWTFPSPLFTHHCFIAARSSWCIPAPCFGPGWWMEKLSMEESIHHLHIPIFGGEERSIEFPLEFSWGFGAASVEEQIFLGVLGVWQLEEHSHGHLEREQSSSFWLVVPHCISSCLIL
eukprot:Gb_31844 [translate_table: standard]